MKKFIILTLISLLNSCMLEEKNEINKNEYSEQKTEFDSTSNRRNANANLSNTNEFDENECVFDTSTFKFTTEALIKYNPNIKFHWNDEDKEAIVKMENTDSLILHIGGCNHFSYSAKYLTDSSKFNNEHYLLEKSRWMAKNFFYNGFENFDRYISQKKYTLERNDADFKSYSIDIDTAITQENEIFDGFSFRKIGNRTEIWIIGYTN